MIPAQCRAARGLLNWDQGRIAVAAGVDAFEAAWSSDEPRQSMARFLAARRAAKT